MAKKTGQPGQKEVSQSVVIAVIVGTTWGALAGASDGWLDDLLMRFVDAILVMPRVLLLLVLASAGPMSPSTLALALGLTAWPPMSRVVRAQVRAIRQREWVVAARALGATRSRILLRHVLPGVLPHIAVAATLLIVRQVFRGQNRPPVFGQAPPPGGRPSRPESFPSGPRAVPSSAPRPAPAASGHGPAGRASIPRTPRCRPCRARRPDRPAPLPHPARRYGSPVH